VSYVAKAAVVMETWLVVIAVYSNFSKALFFSHLSQASSQAPRHTDHQQQQTTERSHLATVKDSRPHLSQVGTRAYYQEDDS
jgi:hypothetical protein